MILDPKTDPFKEQIKLGKFKKVFFIVLIIKLFTTIFNT